MQSFLKKISIIAVVALSISGCKDEADFQELTFSKKFLPPLEAEESFLSVPVFFPYETLSDLLNKSVPHLLVNDDSFEDNNQDNLKVRVERIGNIKVSERNGQISLKVPLMVDAEYQIERPFRMVQPVNCKAEIEINTPVGLGEQWQLITKVTLNKITWIKKPEINLAFFKLDISGQIESLIYKEQEKWMSTIDQAIAKEVNIEKEIVKVYTEIQKPIRLVKREPNLWLYNNCNNLWVSEAKAKKEGVEINASITLRPRIESGFEKEVMPKLLGKNRPSEKPLKGFSLKPNISLKYDDMNQVALEEIANRDFKVSGTVINLEKIRLFGDSLSMYCEATVAKPAKGKVLLEGKPAFDYNLKALTITEMNYLIVDAPGYINVASWYAKDDVLKLLNEKAIFPLGEWIGLVPDLITEAIDKSPVSRNIGVNLSTEDILINEIRPQEDFLQVIGEMNGKTSIKIKSL
jgi:hypothetical protein